MLYLSRLAKLGGALEETQYTYLAPTFSIPFNTAGFEDMKPPLRDESIRANDSVVQGIQQGPASATWEMEHNAYADILGWWLLGMIGPDTVSAGVSTTLASNCSAGATSLSLTASVASDTVISISDTAGAKQEYVSIGTVTGSGPYAAPVVAGGGSGGNSTKYAHTAAGGAVVSQSTHVFAQARTFTTVWPTFSFTVDDGADQTGWPGNVCSELAIKIDTKGFATVSPKFTGFPAVSESTFSYVASTVQPVVGWAWTVTNGGGGSTRGLSMDITLKRAVEALHLSTGLQSPRDVFPGAMEIDGSYKAVFENSTDMNLFEQNNQLPTIHTLTQPVTAGGAVLAVTMSQSGYTTGKRDLGSAYVSADYAVTGIQNTTDGGITQVSLSNFVSSAY